MRGFLGYLELFMFDVQLDARICEGVIFVVCAISMFDVQLGDVHGF